ncbi:MAG: M15 family metallopeptidase [Gammaproteobacteria bacterium]|nr:M15 family metallopeptidase [Gammaproteobacteria bacterium]
MQTLPPQQLYGLNDSHVQALPGAESALIRLQPAAARAFQQMQRAAAAAGHNLQVASGYRDFARQLAIWSRKWANSSQDQAALNAILHWSALPGTSRHHWGTDMDVFDPDALGDAKLQLEPWEYTEQGPFAGLSQWLTEHAADFGFYRCYASTETSGVAVEPWHLSYAPLSQYYPKQITLQGLVQILLEQQLPGFDVVQPQLEQILSRYVYQTSPIPATALVAQSAGGN